MLLLSLSKSARNLSPCAKTYEAAGMNKKIYLIAIYFMEEETASFSSFLKRFYEKRWSKKELRPFQLNGKDSKILEDPREPKKISFIASSE